MAHVHLVGSTVMVVTTRWERPFVAWRAELEVPVAGVEQAELIERPLPATRGLRAGLLVTGLIKVGRWGIGSGRHTFVSIRRGVPAVRLVLDPQAAGRLGYAELLVSTPDAAAVVAAITTRRAAAMR